MKILLIALVILLFTAGSVPIKKNKGTADSLNVSSDINIGSTGNDKKRPADVDENETEKITDEMALASIENYCYLKNPDLKENVESEKYNVYWEISSSDENEVVVLYRSYTSAEVRYYIDRVSGETYVTEFMDGITPEEERTEESFNVRDFIPDNED